MSASRSVRAQAQGGQGAEGAHGGAIVAARDLAAEAGAAALGAGGTAADAAVATAAVLTVVDGANCGIGGLGGFAVIDRGDGRPCEQVPFNARVPGAFRPQDFTTASPGMQVSPPMVVAGLATLHDRFGCLPWRDLWAPAIRIAREGFAVGKDLAGALRWARISHATLNEDFRAFFFPGGQPLGEEDRLVQNRLADTLERIAADGPGAMREGPVARSMAETVRKNGGCLGNKDLAALEAQASPAETQAYEGASVSAADPQHCGAGILFTALERLQGAVLADARGEAYVKAVGEAIAAGWKQRRAGYQVLTQATGHTSHLCAADADGMLVSLTFTHGPSWFGSGLLDPDTGVLLNMGAAIFARRVADGGLVAQPNLSPVVVRHGEARYALGSPGGPNIPAIVCQAIVDLVHYKQPPGSVLGGARLSADAEGRIGAEASLARAFPTLVRREIAREEYYGPAGLIAWERGSATPFSDPRFGGAARRAP